MTTFALKPHQHITTRQIWMFPRNKRRIIALDISIMLRALVIASEKGTTWVGDQAQQDEFSKILEGLGLKGGGNQIDKNSGGPRTYIAQFQCIGLLSKIGRADIRFTQSGEDMAHFEQPADALRWQLLKMQYPSEYSIGTMVRIDPSIKIRPAQFLIELANDPDIGGLSDEDIMIPVVFGKTHNSFNSCKNLILKARTEGIQKVIDNVDLLMTARTTGRTIKERLKEVKDVANTFANALIGSGLCQRIYVDNASRVIFNSKYNDIFQEVKNIPIVNFTKANQLQDSLKIGNRRGALKDTRRIFMPTVDIKMQSKRELILKAFFETISFPVSQSDIATFTKVMLKKYGVDEKFILDAIKPILTNSTQYVNSKLIELSQAGKERPIEFEKAIAQIFKDDFGYDATNIGQRKRDGVGGFADIFIIETERGKCGIIDAKATHKYDLPHNDYAKMLTTYIPSVSELYPVGKSLELSFVGYVSHLIGNGAKSKAQDIYNSSGIPVVLCSVYGLNNLRENPLYKKNPTRVTDLFTSNSVVQIDR